MIKILVVDDEKDICDFVFAFFSLRGFKVYCATSGEEALNIAKREDPLIILQDVRMAGIDGLETLRRMKELRPNNRVIMVTGADEVDKINKAKKFGADGYITKPLILDDLVRAVQEASLKLKPNR